MRRIIAIMLLCLTLSSCSLPRTTAPRHGVWYVNATGTTSQLYKGDASTGQKIVDAENSALWMKYGKGHAILDHADSVCGDGVWNVNEMQVGGLADLSVGGKKTYYECTAIWLCTQTRYVYRYDGRTVSVKKGDIICVSCADEDGYDYVAYYRKCG